MKVRFDTRRRMPLRVVCSIVVLVAMVLLPGGPAAATTFSNSSAITVADSSATSGLQANVYPSTIAVSGVTGAIADVNVSLVQVGSTYTRGLDVLLVGPHGQSLVVVADAGAGTSPSSSIYTFDDGASSQLPATGNLSGGTYKPSNLGSFDGTPPAPGGPYGSTLSVFNGTDANGTWSLYVFSDASGGAQTFSQGWSLDVTAASAPSITSFAPASGKVGDTVVVTGTNLTGATVVRFGGTAAPTFTVDSATQITATVPAGAHTGPIAVTAPGGSATSAANFAVQHEREVSLRLVGKNAKGQVGVVDGFAACASNVVVKLQHREHHRWRLVGEAFSQAGGSYQVGGLHDPGKYRAIAKTVTQSTGDVCLRTVSPVIKRNRP